MPFYPSYSHPRFHPSLLHPSPTTASSPVSQASPEQDVHCVGLPVKARAGTTEVLMCLTSTYLHEHQGPGHQGCKQTSQRHLDTVKESRLLFNFKDQSLTLSTCKSYSCQCRNLLVSRGPWFTQLRLSPVLSAATLMLRCGQKYSAEA